LVAFVQFSAADHRYVTESCPVSLCVFRAPLLWLSQLVGLVPETRHYRHVIHDSVAGVCLATEAGSVTELVAPESHDQCTAAASGFDRVTEFGYFSIVGEKRLLVHGSVAGGMCFGYGDGSAAIYASEDNFHFLITSGTDVV
jgi:hypothetical protein